MDTPSRIHKPKKGSVSRRDILKGTAGAGATLLTMPLVSLPRPAIAASEIESELVFACNGGSTQRIFEEEFFPEFASMHPGIRMIYVPGQPPETLAKLRAQGESAGIDVAWLAGGHTYSAGDEGLIVDIDRSLVPSYAKIPEAIGNEAKAVPIGITICGLLANSDIFKKEGLRPATSWYDLWDPQLKGHAGIYTMSITATLAMFALIAKLETGDYKNFEVSFAKFKELHPNIANYYTSAGAWETAFQQGDMWLGMNNGARALQLKQSGMPLDFVIPKEGTVGYQTWVSVPKGAPHPKAAHAWIEYLLTPSVQERFAAKIGYMPVVPDAKIDPDLKVYYPDLSQVFLPDWRYLSTQHKQLIDRWNREIER